MADRLNPTHLTLRLLQLPTRASLAAAHGVRTESFRMLTVVGLHVDNDLGTTAGWGECSALNEVGYTNESAEGTFDLLRSGTSFDSGAHPMAVAAVEMALLDAQLKAAGESLADRLGTSGLTAPAGAVVGLAPIPVMLDEVEGLVESGYRRLKCKIAPGKITTPIEAIRTSFPDIELQVDANASLQAEDIPALLVLHDLGVTAIEQPFAVADHDAATRLVAAHRVGQSGVEVVGDEAVQNGSDVDRLAANGGATAVAIKPSKLGGIQAALDVLDRVTAAGFGASIGGMLESGLGRHVLAAFAPLPAFNIVGDLSPAKRWLDDDPFRDIALKRGHIVAPSRPGVAGEPAMNRLDRYTVRKAVVPASTANWPQSRGVLLES